MPATPGEAKEIAASTMKNRMTDHTDPGAKGGDIDDVPEKKGTIRKLALASFLNDMGSDMIYPVWPMFVTSLPGANMVILGLLDGLGDMVVSVSQALSGYLSDRWKRRKPFIWIGYLMGSFSRIGYATSIVWPQLFVFRILDRGGKIRSAPRDAMVADLSTGKNRGLNFGFLRSMDHLGAVFGILICIALVEKLGYRNLFFLAAIPSLVGVAVIFFLIRERVELRDRVFKGFSIKDYKPDLVFFFILSSFFSLGFFSYSFLLLYAKKAGVVDTTLIMFYLTFTLSASLSSGPFGKLSDRIGRKKILALSFLLWISVCFSFHLFTTPAGMFAVFVLYGLQKGALEPVQRAYVSELAPQEARASVLGTFQMVTGILSLPSSVLAGMLWDRFSPNAPLYLSGVLTVIALVLLSFVKESRMES